jgi:hypothetical protein
MSTTDSETLALERPQQQDEFLAMVERFMERPDMSPEKLEKLMHLKFEWDDRQAKKAYDAAMIAVRPQIRAVPWDKFNSFTNSRYASYPKIDEMLTPILTEYGLAISFDTEPDPRPNMMMGCCDVIHEDGYTKRHRLPMPIDGSGPKQGGVMTGPQAVKSGVSYMIRTFVGMIFAIPLLVDKDDNDGNPIRPPIDDAEKSNLEKLMKGFSPERRKWLLDQFGIADLAGLPRSKYNNAIDKINLANRKDAERSASDKSKGENKEHWSKNATVNQDQEATLQALIDEIGGTCNTDFLTANKINKVSDLPAQQYQGALASLTQQRRK